MVMIFYLPSGRSFFGFQLDSIGCPFEILKQTSHHEVDFIQKYFSVCLFISSSLTLRLKIYS